MWKRWKIVDNVRCRLINLCVHVIELSDMADDSINNIRIHVKTINKTTETKQLGIHLYSIEY